MTRHLAQLLILCLRFLLILADSDEGFCSIDQQCNSRAQNKHDHPNLYRQVDNQPSPAQKTKQCLRAAVVEFNRHDLDDCKSSARRNLDRLERATQLAAKNGVQMIVYPEDGIFIGDSSYIRPCLEEIPDPERLDQANRNPCLQAESFKPHETLRRLSCIARENSMYVIANYGSKETCDPGAISSDNITNKPDCPNDGIIPLNTDVVFDTEGNYIKRYRKWNPFIEVFSKAPILEHTYFDTPFGRFGLFTCFDILFKRPSIDLVEKYNIDAAIFPTFWYDELPLLTATQIQDGWSWANRVDILGSNILKPELGSTGSGIFSGLDSVYVGAGNKKSKVIMANLQSEAGNQNHSSCEGSFQADIMDIDEEDPLQVDYQNKNYDLFATDGIRKFDKLSGEETVCSGEVCCSVDYELDERTSSGLSSKLILIVRDARRQGYFKWHEQVCALATIKEQSGDGHSSISFSSEALVAFKRLSISATFTTHYVYPITGHNATLLLDRSKRKFECDDVDPEPKEVKNTARQHYCQLDLLNGEKPTRLYSFAMYGRPYEGDASSLMTE